MPNVKIPKSTNRCRVIFIPPTATKQQLGDPTDVTIRFNGAWRRIAGMIDIPEVHATVVGAALSGSITLRDLDTDPVIDLALGMQHLDFAQLLGASGLAVPESLGMALLPHLFHVMLLQDALQPADQFLPPEWNDRTAPS
jgi:hypothetical protein